MSVVDSVSVFAEGTFEEQLQELVGYIARSRPEDARASLLQLFQDILRDENELKTLESDEEKKRVFSMVLDEVNGLGDGSEKEIEGFFNLLYSHLFSLWQMDSDTTKQYVTKLLATISSTPRSDHSNTKYRILSNMFNATPRNSAFRLQIYTTLLQLASSNEQLDMLKLSRTDVDRWLREWAVADESKSAFLKSIVDAFIKSGQMENAYEYTLLYVSSLPSSSPSSQPAAVDAISIALRVPSVFDFDALFKLDAVIAAKDHEVFSLLQIFLNNGLPEFQAWMEAHSDVLEKYELERGQLERKIRLLTFASLGFENVGRDLPYSKIASALQIAPSEVERWSIDVIRTGLLSGKLSQKTQTLHVIRSSARTFQQEQWGALEKRLLAWKTGLAGVLEVVAVARGGVSSAGQSTQSDPKPVSQETALQPEPTAAVV